LLQPRYIEGLLRTAEQRKVDRIRAEDKMVQREREKEGEEFADKEAFVTEAYKEQQAELRKAEEEEARREGAPLWLFH
jgi:coiled-coil domain-containing protein 55